MKLPQKVIQTQARNPKVTLLPARSQKASVSVEGNFEKKNDSETNDGEVPLYEGAKVLKLCALMIVMLFCLRHKLSGQPLVDLVKVLHALI